MKQQAIIRAAIFLFGAAAIIFAFYGCANVGLMSGLNVSNVSDTIVLKNPTDNILDASIGVAESMGFRITSMDIVQKVALLQLSDLGSFSNPLPWLIGKIDNSHVTITVLSAQSLSVQVRTAGTFGSGNYSDAVSLLNEFKKRIYMRMQ